MLGVAILPTILVVYTVVTPSVPDMKLSNHFDRSFGKNFLSSSHHKRPMLMSCSGSCCKRRQWVYVKSLLCSDPSLWQIQDSLLQVPSFVRRGSLACLLASHVSGWFSRPDYNHDGLRETYAFLYQKRAPGSSFMVNRKAFSLDTVIFLLKCVDFKPLEGGFFSGSSMPLFFFLVVSSSFW